MSRIGKNPIPLPDGVSASVSGRRIEVKGPKGTLDFTATDDVSVEIAEGVVKVSPKGKSKRARQQWGMARSMVANCVAGVTAGFRKELAITGVGYRAQMQDRTLNLALGLSHDVRFETPEGVTISVPAAGRIVIEGIDKQKVGQTAAEIRAWRPPEPFKGKGIRYADEEIFRKVGKKK